METVLFTTAEYATVSHDGKLSISGIFDSIQAAEFPANAPRMYLVALFRAQPDEYEQVYDLRFRLYSPSKEELIDLNTAGEVPYSDHDLSVLMNQIVTLNNVSFKAPGTYTFVAMLNGTEVATLPFNVVQMKKPSNAIR
jgi:hypothetical protein